MPLSLSRLKQYVARTLSSTGTPSASPVPAEWIDYRTPWAQDRVPFVVLWSQKSACTTLLKWFLTMNGRYEEACRYLGRDDVVSLHRFENEVMKQEAGYRYNLAMRLQRNGPSLAFIRCPYARAFSSYMHLQNPAFRRVRAQGRQNAGMSLRLQIAGDLAGPDGGLETPLSFEDYLYWLVDVWPDLQDPHHLPQATALWAYCQPRCYPTEHLKEILPCLEQRYGTRRCSADILGTGSGHHIQAQPMGRQAVHEFLATPQPLDVEKRHAVPRVTREDLKGTTAGRLIERLFADDLEWYEQALAQYAAMPSTAC